MVGWGNSLLGLLALGGGVYLLTQSASSKSEDSEGTTTTQPIVIPSPLAGIDFSGLLGGGSSGDLFDSLGASDLMTKKDMVMADSGIVSGQVLKGQTNAFNQALGQYDTLNRQLEANIFTVQKTTDIFGNLGALIGISPEISGNLSASEQEKLLNIPLTGVGAVGYRPSSSEVALFDVSPLISNVDTKKALTVIGGGGSSSHSDSNKKAIEQSVSLANEFRKAATDAGVSVRYGG